MPASSSEPPLIADTSVVVKWLVEEVDSDRALVLEGRVLHTPTVVLAECATAIWAKLRLGDITRGGAEACLDGRVITADWRFLQRVQAHTHLVQRIRPLAGIH